MVLVVELGFWARQVASRIALNEELEEARIRAEEEARLEQERKDDLIRQIRALERVPKQRVKMFDPTESSGVGLLEEMSLVELRERLELNKVRCAMAPCAWPSLPLAYIPYLVWLLQARLEEERSERRDKILRRKKEREIDLRARVANITRIRGEQTALLLPLFLVTSRRCFPRAHTHRVCGRRQPQGSRSSQEGRG